MICSAALFGITAARILCACFSFGTSLPFERIHNERCAYHPARISEIKVRGLCQEPGEQPKRMEKGGAYTYHSGNDLWNKRDHYRERKSPDCDPRQERQRMKP